MNHVDLSGILVKSPKKDSLGRWRILLTVPEQPAGPIPVYLNSRTRGPIRQLRGGRMVSVSGVIYPRFLLTPAGPMTVLEVAAREIKLEGCSA